jgi:hypothetical protein
MDNGMTHKKECTFWVKIYSSGPIEVAKQIIRRDVLEKGLCVTIEPTTFIYTGGEEFGYVVGLINYPRFPNMDEEIWNRAISLALRLLNETFQNSILVMSPIKTMWLSKRDG